MSRNPNMRSSVTRPAASQDNVETTTTTSIPAMQQRLPRRLEESSEVVAIDDDEEDPVVHQEREHAPGRDSSAGAGGIVGNLLNRKVSSGEPGSATTKTNNSSYNNPHQHPNVRSSVQSHDSNGGNSTMMVLPSLALMGIILLLAMILGLTGTVLGIYNTVNDNGSSIAKSDLNDDGDSTTTSPSISTLERILERGYLNCGTGPPDLPGFLFPSNDTVNYSGLEFDLCLILTSAVFNGELVNLATNEPRYRIVPTDFVRERWERIVNGTIDVLFRATYNMERDAHEPTVQQGMEFSTPYYWDGVVLGGLPDHLPCAEALDFNSTLECTETKICVTAGSSHVFVLEQYLGEELAPEVLRVVESIQTGFPVTCQVVASEMSDIHPQAMKSRGYFGEYVLGSQVFSREPLSIVTKQGDPRWSDFVEWIVQALIFAEEEKITMSNRTLLQPAYNTFGGNETHPDPQGLEFMFQNALKVRGNYGDLYQFHLEPILPRGGMNELNKGDLPIIHSLPFGDTDVLADELEVTSPTVRIIKERGFLSCGVSLRTGFAEFDPETREWSGFDVELCRAITAALFDGVDRNVVFTDLPAAQRFRVLAEGRVDILARLTTWTLSRDVREPTTGMGLSFSTPYFHDGLKFGGVGRFTQCANNLDVLTPECQNLQICVLDGTTLLTIARELYPSRFINPQLTFEDIIDALNEGTCNAVAGGFQDVAVESILDRGYVGEEEYTVGEFVFSKDPLALTTRQDDPLWNDFVRWIFEALVHAEEIGVTQETATAMPRTKLFGPLRTNALYHAVNAVGNYGELYNRNFATLVPRGGLHDLNKDFGPSLRALPGIPL